LLLLVSLSLSLLLVLLLLKQEPLLLQSVLLLLPVPLRLQLVHLLLLRQTGRVLLALKPLGCMVGEGQQLEVVPGPGVRRNLQGEGAQVYIRIFLRVGAG